MAETTLSGQIHLDRDQTRSQIVNYVKHYLELENVDLTKSSFLSFLIDIISTLTSNLLFYQSSVYREFFLTKAQLPESVFNLSAFLGYNTQEASYATTNILLTIPLNFSVASASFSIPSGAVFKAGSIEFVTFYDTAITVINNSTVSIIMTESGKIYNIPYTAVAGESFQFILPLRQYQSNVQEFQIPEDLQTYQFSTIDVPLTGQVSSMIVNVRDPGDGSWRIYNEFSSLYLMSATDYGYVSRRTDSGRKLYFGNGLIGEQPPTGATVRVTVLETDGSSGNAIAGSITKGDRIYTTTPAGLAQVVSYSVTNPSSASGGSDEESIEEIRSNAIANLTALGRLVSEVDYTNVDVIIPNSPIQTNSIAVLKRSDLNVNEIQLYIALDFNNDIVPTRNVLHQIPITTTSIDRGLTITVDSEEYTTVFDMTIDHTLNKKAYYEYVMYQLNLSPLLVRTYSSTYDIVIDNLLVYRTGNTVTFDAHYQSPEVDTNLCTCELEIHETSETFAMVNNDSTSTFNYTFSNYSNIPEGELTCYFTISHPVHGNIARYSSILTIRKSLDAFMMSNISTDETSVTTIYDIPVIRKSWYDALTLANVQAFELNVLQTLVSTMEFSGYRMLTDFVNLKFTNTHGIVTNMQHNEINISSVADIAQSSVPLTPSVGDRYIINGYESNYTGSLWEGHKDEIAQCTDSTSITWTFSSASTDDMVSVTSQRQKYIYTETGWVVPNYQIPLQITMDVFKSSTATASNLELSNTIKSALVTEFTSRFGSNTYLYRSEIVDIVQGTIGVDHCRLIEPESSIFFNFDLRDMTEQQLLEYGPDYIYFTTDDIEVRVL